MKVLVTGAAGMLGSSMVPTLISKEHTVKATDINMIGDEIDHLDVRDSDEMLRVASDFSPSILLHLAAETDLETCETRVDYAYEENFVGTQNACVASRTLDIPLVYVSTAGVFDGTKDEPYTEFDAPNPINVYGHSKLMGEEIVRQTVPNHYIVRAGWMIGGGNRDKKFVHKIIDQIDNGKSKIYAVTDKIGTPTYALAFSIVLEKLMRTNWYGTYHLACKGRATRYDVAEQILKVLGRSDITLEPVTSEHFKEEFFAPRPRSEEMRNYALDLRAANDMPNWKTALEEYLRSSFEDRFA